jgi:hypothetical protein
MIRLRSSAAPSNTRAGWALPALGAAFCALFILIPEGAAMLGAPAGQTWVPVSSQYQMMGDSYAYAAMVQEVREDFWRHSGPVSPELGGAIPVDKFRALTYRGLAIGGLFLRDARYAFLLSYICFACLNFLLVYRLAREVRLAPLAALATGVAVLFWLKAPYYVDNLPFSRLADLWTHMKENAFIGNVDFELYNDNFRYAILHTAICVLWAFLIALLRFDRKPSFRAAIPATLFGIALVYSYYSLATIGALILAGYFLLALVRRDFAHSGSLAGLGAGIIALGILVGTPADVRAVISMSTPIVDLHVAAVPWGGFAAVRDTVLRNLSIAPIVLLVAIGWWFRGASSLSRLGVACLFAGAVLLLAQLVPPSTAVTRRFLYRGFSHVAIFLWLALFLHLLGCSEDGRSAPMRGKSVRTVLLAALVIVLAGVPALGDLKLARAFHRSEARRIPECQWASYEHLLKTTTPNAEVLALDWEDVLLLPVYTHADLYFGDVSFTGRSQVEEARRYLRSWYFLGYPQDLLRKRIEESGRNEVVIGYPTPLRAVDKTVAEGPMLMWHLFYNPYIKTFDGLPIRTSPRVINPDFVHRVFALASPSDSIDMARDTSIHSILLSADYEQLRPAPFAPIPGFNLVMRTGCRTLYGRAS